MKRRYPISRVATLASLAVLAASAMAPAWSGQSARAFEIHRERQAAEAAARSAAPPPAPAPQARPQPQQPRFRGPPPTGSGQRHYRPNNDRPVTVGPPRGPQGPNARIVPPSRGHVHRPPPPRTVDRLPPAHRHYDWHGSRYYWGGGHWYRPHHNHYVVVRPPVGLWVSALPGAYSTIWVGGTRYYYADGAYFTYEPVRRGYVVTRSPYGDDYDEYEDEPGPDADLYIYPMRGQSEQQQRDDRYECHRWAVDQVHYDPTGDEYVAEKRSDYDRALTACLTGRGYSVK